MDAAIISRIAGEASLPENSVAATVDLFEKGATAPFIVHYRKEVTGGMDEIKVRTIQERYTYYREILERRASILRLIADQGKMSEDLRSRIEGSFTRVELEDMYHQFRPKKRTRAAEAIEKGLEPLAEFIFNQEPDAWSLQEHIDVCVDPTKKVATREQALQGATEIIAQWISENIELRKALREMLWHEGNVVSTVVPAKAEQKTKYNMYYNRREPVTTIPSHRVLAIRRGSKEGILTSSIEGDHAKAIEFLLNSVIRDKESFFAPILEVAVRESYARILKPLIETEVRAQLKERADREAIRVFQENLANLLLSPPAGQMVVAGFDMVKSGDCTVAAVDENGKFLEECVIRFTPPRTPAKGQAKSPVKPAPIAQAAPAPEAAPEAAVISVPSETVPLIVPSGGNGTGEIAESAAEMTAPAEVVPESPAVEAEPHPDAMPAPEGGVTETPVEPSPQPAMEESVIQAEPADEVQQAVPAPAPAVEDAESTTEDPAPGGEAIPTAAETAGHDSEPDSTDRNDTPVPQAAAAADVTSTPDAAAFPPSMGDLASTPPVEAAGTAPPESGVAEPDRAKPATAQDFIAKARQKIRELIDRHKVRAIAIGAGTGARELETTLRQILAEEKIEDVLVAAVNDAGIAVYSSSRVAREELPDLAVSARCATSLARRLQDPLAEMVKIDPKLIGVGQYQHDVDQKELHRGLLQTVQFCVNNVGVDANLASHSLLRYAAGLNDRLAHRVVGFRAANGPFPSRQALLKVSGCDAAVWEQAAGFLRIRGGEHPLDATAVHPSSYPIVDRMAASHGVSVGDLIGNKELVNSIKLEDYATDTVGIPTLQDIREELLRPGRDPRRTFALPKFRSDVKSLVDLQKGMVLEGTVTNVTNFGAFVDIGVHQDGLVHLSQMSTHFIRDPREAVKVGDVVQVKVISVEVETKRIGLSMKALLPSPNRRRRKGRRPTDAAPAAAGGQRASDPASPDLTAEPVFAESGPRARLRPGDSNRRGRRDRDRPRRRDNRRPSDREGAERTDRRERQVQPATLESKSDMPEQTLQEKIAILQSKFRGIN